jgi:hypothetical protein
MSSLQDIILFGSRFLGSTSALTRGMAVLNGTSTPVITITGMTNLGVTLENGTLSDLPTVSISSAESSNGSHWAGHSVPDHHPSVYSAVVAEAPSGESMTLGCTGSTLEEMKEYCAAKAAHLVCSCSGDVSNVTTTALARRDDGDCKKNVGAIVGGAVGGTVVAGGLGFLGWKLTPAGFRASSPLPETGTESMLGDALRCGIRIPGAGHSPLELERGLRLDSIRNALEDPARLAAEKLVSPQTVGPSAQAIKDAEIAMEAAIKNGMSHAEAVNAYLNKFASSIGQEIVKGPLSQATLAEQQSILNSAVRGVAEAGTSLAEGGAAGATTGAEAAAAAAGAQAGAVPGVEPVPPPSAPVVPPPKVPETLPEGPPRMPGSFPESPPLPPQAPDAPVLPPAGPPSAPDVPVSPPYGPPSAPDVPVLPPSGPPPAPVGPPSPPEVPVSPPFVPPQAPEVPALPPPGPDPAPVDTPSAPEIPVLPPSGPPAPPVDPPLAPEVPIPPPSGPPAAPVDPPSAPVAEAPVPQAKPPQAEPPQARPPPAKPPQVKPPAQKPVPKKITPEDLSGGRKGLHGAPDPLKVAGDLSCEDFINIKKPTPHDFARLGTDPDWDGAIKQAQRDARGAELRGESTVKYNRKAVRLEEGKGKWEKYHADLHPTKGQPDARGPEQMDGAGDTRGSNRNNPVSQAMSAAPTNPALPTAQNNGNKIQATALTLQPSQMPNSAGNAIAPLLPAAKSTKTTSRKPKPVKTTLSTKHVKPKSTVYSTVDITRTSTPSIKEKSTIHSTVEVTATTTPTPDISNLSQHEKDMLYVPPGDLDTRAAGLAKHIREEIGFYDVDPNTCACPAGQHEKKIDNGHFKVWITGSKKKKVPRKVKCVPGQSKKQKKYSPSGPTENFHQQCYKGRRYNYEYLLGAKAPKICEWVPMEGWYRNGEAASRKGWAGTHNTQFYDEWYNEKSSY